MSVDDITKPVDLFTHSEGTGPLRFRRPIYVDFMPPCNSACPAGENIQAWMSQAQEGKYFDAFQIILLDNPFPATMGRICVRPCETGCNRTHIDSTVNIHAVERFIGDMAIQKKWQVNFSLEPSGKKVLIVGAGPSGLSAAYHLKRMGHDVEIHEASDHAGGLMWTGIPDYRLPKEILDAEIERIIKMGVKIKLNHKVQDLWVEKEKGGFDVVYLAIGSQLIAKEQFPHDNSVKITDAFSFFKDVKVNPSSLSGKKVIAYGGGKLALYISRMIKRLGSEISVYYPGDKTMMPAYDYETEDALAEGVQIQLLKSISRIEKQNIIFETTKVEKGKLLGINEFEKISADVLIIANRQESDSSFLRSVETISLNTDGTIVIDAKRMTGREGIFAGGDMLPGENRSTTIAIGHGKKAARFIHGSLSNQPYIKSEKHPTAGYRKLHMWYKTEAPQKEQHKLAPEIAIKSFDEVIAGLSETETRFEAQRCLSCGNCFECDGCFAACPEDAIIKLDKGKRYQFNLDACTGCAVCYEQCPCHAIEMIPEPVNSTKNVKQ
ncbi:MAG TPA: NAD(P)-binding protein [Puia sp.]|nr:NAD(P)-binding protein [Puia sp.]